MDNATLSGLDTLYARPTKATRAGPLFAAFPYPTKISPETIALFIAAHTKPGELVFDGFAGSGTTGVAALLCAKPPRALQDEAKRLGLDVCWGPRRAMLHELSVLGSFIARTLCAPPDPPAFRNAALKLLEEVERDYGWVYEARSPKGQFGQIRYVIWTDVLCCPACRKAVSMWEACVTWEPATINSIFTCPACRHRAPIDGVERLTEQASDDLLSTPRHTRLRRPAWLCGKTETTNWDRGANESDLQLLEKIGIEPLPRSVPKVPISWGDLHRSGYHSGITHLHHFYTRRNLIVFGALWHRVEVCPEHLRDALRFWLLSYNASHSTTMTRVVAKTGQNGLVVTSAQPGVLYVSGLPVEKNLLTGLRRKLATIVDAFTITREQPDLVEVRNQSSVSVDLADGSVDYVFADPPFGGNIPYAEVNFINEAWLGRFTQMAQEITVSRHQKKTVDDYETTMIKALREVHRVLKEGRKATLVFHSTSADVWNALQRAYQEAGFTVERTSVLDKTQGSFKQVTTSGAARGDAVLLLSKEPTARNGQTNNTWQIVHDLIQRAAAAEDPSERTPQRLYSRLVVYCLLNQLSVPLDAETFYRRFAERMGADGRPVSAE